MPKIPEYTQYFEAVSNILNGIPVLHLDRIRNHCNENFLKKGKTINDFYKKIPQSEAILMSFCANAENQILMGKNPEEVYFFDKRLKTEEFRKRSLIILKNAVRKYS